MEDASGDVQFVGSIPAIYESVLVPMIFEEPARALASAVGDVRPTDILETAAGTGVLTRLLAELPNAVVTATDLNPAMLEEAQQRFASDRVTWQVADAMELPFDDGQFDVVACQFGAMFFPDKVAGYAETARVLRPGGAFAFNVWDRIETNEVAKTVTDALCAGAPDDALDFLKRTPHGHFDADVIDLNLRAAGYEDISIERMKGTSRTTAQQGAIAYCQGTPLRGEIEKSSLDVESATAIAAEALEATFGSGPFDAPTGWLQVTACCSA
jgi:ubiquinone/menaquinone biosynthesis C-methylase UbiE